MEPQGSPSGVMDKVTETWVTAPERPVSLSGRNACLVHIYPTGPSMGTRYAISAGPLVIGRASDCDIRINDHSVSRRHARIQPGADGFYAVDLQSTNGTYINDMPASMYKLKDGDYLRVGNCIYRFLMGGNVETEYHEEIYRLTIIDGLTEIHNKRYLLEFLDREIARSSRHNTPMDGALTVADRILKVVNQTPFVFEDKNFTVTVSAGVVTTQGEGNMTATDLIRRADEKLYQAKKEGRDRFC